MYSLHGGTETQPFLDKIPVWEIMQTVQAKFRCEYAASDQGLHCLLTVISNIDAKYN